ncbi:MAG: hypothetical protein LUC94_14825, partial [Clostridiales bacterium]|nr:hypothetical protein [Clostridiales bacterium]
FAMPVFKKILPGSDKKCKSRLYNLHYWKRTFRAGLEKSGFTVKHAPREKFYFTNGKAWVGVDNSTGDLWVEEFITEAGCIAWLEGDFAADGLKEELKDELKEETE